VRGVRGVRGVASQHPPGALWTRGGMGHERDYIYFYIHTHTVHFAHETNVTT